MPAQTERGIRIRDRTMVNVMQEAVPNEAALLFLENFDIPAAWTQLVGCPSKIDMNPEKLIV
jgi:hypothetical protein